MELMLKLGLGRVVEDNVNDEFVRPFGGGTGRPIPFEDVTILEALEVLHTHPPKGSTILGPTPFEIDEDPFEDNLLVLVIVVFCV